MMATFAGLKIIFMRRWDTKNGKIQLINGPCLYVYHIIIFYSRKVGTSSQEQKKQKFNLFFFSQTNKERKYHNSWRVRNFFSISYSTMLMSGL